MEYVISVIPTTTETIIKKQQKKIYNVMVRLFITRTQQYKAVRGEVNSQMGQFTQ